jgi:hypothetical protein
MASSKQLKAVLEMLPQLTPNELVVVNMRLQLLLPKKAKASDKDWLLAGLAAELKRRGILASPQIPSAFLPKDFAGTSEHIRLFLTKGLGKFPYKTVHLHALGRLAAEALVEELIRQKIPLTPKTLTAQVGSIPRALDNAYPGYWQSAALAVCLGNS